jgi:hypothetical protein
LLIVEGVHARRHCEEQSDEAIQFLAGLPPALARARNDVTRRAGDQPC